MPDPTDTPQTNPYTSLGLRFWLPWNATLLALLGAWAGSAYLAVSLLAQPWRVIAVTTGIIVFTVALTGLTMLPRRILQQRGLEEPTRPAYQRYLWRFLPPMLAYCVLFIGATQYFRGAHPTGIILWLTALIPAVPVMFAIRAIALLPREESDEYLRQRLNDEFRLATCFMLGVCAVLGFLDQFQVIPHIPLWVAFPLWAMCLCPAQFILHKRY